MEIGNLDVHLRRRQHIEDRAARRPRLPGNLRQLGAVGAVTKPGASGSQRAIVKVMPVGSGGTRQHLSYLQYQKGHNQAQAPLYGPGANDPLGFAAQAQQDAHQFRLIVSPQEHQLGEQRAAFIAVLMRQMERDVGRSLEWVAADHYDTRTPHTHIALRGVANDKPLYLTKSYFEHGIRDRAEALLTQYLGPQQQQHRYTEEQSMAETGTNWAWELQQLQSRITHDAERAIAVWHARWKSILDQEVMHTRFAGKQSTFIPSAEPWGQQERVWIEKPLEEKTADVREMIANLGKRVERMIANKDSETMDAGWHVGVALSVHAAEIRRREESEFKRQELAFDEDQLRIAAGEPLSRADVNQGEREIQELRRQQRNRY